MAALTPAAFAEARPHKLRSAEEHRRQRAIREAASAVADVFDGIVLAKTDLTIRQAAVLARVVQAPGEHNITSLSVLLAIGKPTVTRALDRLRNLDLAHRRISEDDRRHSFVDPTPKGEAWVRAVAITLGAEP